MVLVAPQCEVVLHMQSFTVATSFRLPRQFSHETQRKRWWRDSKFDITVTGGFNANPYFCYSCYKSKHLASESQNDNASRSCAYHAFEAIVVASVINMYIVFYHVLCCGETNK